MSVQAAVSIGCVLMAAGRSARFGENKLLRAFEGKSLIERALDAVPERELRAVCVVSSHREILALAAARGFMTVLNPRPEDGASLTVRLGLDALEEIGACMFMVGDQPLLNRDSLRALLRFYAESPEHIAALSHGGVRGNPCVFPKSFFPQLRALTGDNGGSAVIRAHEDKLRLYEVPARELGDVDYPRDLDRLRAWL